MKRCLTVLLGLFLVSLFAPVASACNACVPAPCSDPEMWWDCSYCNDPGLGNEGSLYCVMYPDGGCQIGSPNCFGVTRLLTTPFKASWQVASVRVLTPNTPIRAEADVPITVAAGSYRSTRR